MPKGMLGLSLQEAAGPIEDLLEKLCGDEGPECLKAFKRFLRKEDHPWPEAVKVASDLFEFVTTVKQPAIPSFDAEAMFVVTPEEQRKTAKVLIGWVGPKLQGLVKGLVETDVAEATLNVRQLTRLATNRKIFDALGGEGGIEVALAHVWQMLEPQGRGREGILLTNNGWANIIPVRINGVTWAVYCYWRPDYGDWDVEAYPVTYPNEWYAGDRVFSR
ncbi:MAG: hypothetical protein AAB785_00525 [Patescibacteria group bacterium]